MFEIATTCVVTKICDGEFDLHCYLGGGGVSGKVHSEHIVATKVFRGGGGWVSGKVHSEHIVATKVLMPMGGGGGESAL